jgi:hypothetical protein
MTALANANRTNSMDVRIYLFSAEILRFCILALDHSIYNFFYFHTGLVVFVIFPNSAGSSRYTSNSSSNPEARTTICNGLLYQSVAACQLLKNL